MPRRCGQVHLAPLQVHWNLDQRAKRVKVGFPSQPQVHSPSPMNRDRMLRVTLRVILRVIPRVIHRVILRVNSSGYS